LATKKKGQMSAEKLKEMEQKRQGIMIIYIFCIKGTVSPD
jgi:hypothetical protein